MEQIQCGKIKGRLVADGSKMKLWYTKEETASSTDSTKALKISLVIDALEERSVAIADVPGDFLQADMPDLMLIFL